MAKGDLKRLASGFVTLWIWLFAPSFVGWGIAVRFFDGGTDRFHDVWHWLEDKPTYPRLVSPISSVAWNWLEDGGAIQAFIGFVVLVALWSAILAVPPLLIAFWWRLAAGRLVGGSSRVDDHGQASPFVNHPLSPLYIITIPVALIWAGLRKCGNWVGNSPTIVICLGLFILTGVLVTGFFALMFGFSSYWERYEILDFVSNTLWYGYLDTFHVPHVFQEQWYESMRTIRRTTEQTSYNEWPDYMGSWYRHPEFRTVVWTTAVRNGLAVVGAYLLFRLGRRIVKGVW